MNTMQIIHKISTAVLIALLPASALAGSFNEISKLLDTDGDFLAYADFQGDGGKIGQALNEIYAELVVNQPLLAMVQMDFARLFETLGFGCIRSLGASSKPLNEGIFANRSAILLQEGTPEGLFAIYGEPQIPETPFTAAKLAPADATVAISGTLQLQAVRDTTLALLSQSMGPLGENMAKVTLSKTIPGTDITYEETIEVLSGKWDLFWQEDFDESFNPSYKIWMRIEGASHIAVRLKPLANGLPVTVTETEDGLKADLSSLLSVPDYGLYIEASTVEDTLTLYTHSDWGPKSAGPRLNQTQKFTKLAKHLPKKALNFSYTDAYDLDVVLKMVAENSPEFAAYSQAIEKTLDLFLGDFLEPAVTASYFKNNSFVTDIYSAYSYKQIGALLPGVFFGGIAAAVAVPALNSMEMELPEPK
jgi:hypothetical protein